MKYLNLTALERETLRMLLDGDDPLIVALNQQYSQVVMVNREITGHGFYLYFDLPINTRKVNDIYPVKEDFCFGDVEATTPYLKFGIGFLLWVKSGKLRKLEGYTYDEDLPLSIDEFRLRYIKNRRDWDDLHKIWLIKLDEI